MTIRNGEAIPLWPDGAPGLKPELPETAPTLTPWLLPRPSATGGVVIVCPGGGYNRRAPHEGDPVAQRFRACGIASLVLAYRVAPYRHPVPLGDAARAIRWVRAQAGELGVSPERVAILGFSAGGHLAAMAATRGGSGDPGADDPTDRQSARPDAAILCYPAITSGAHGHRGCFNSLLGPDASDEARRELSAELQVGLETPPTFLWHTADDQGVLVENSLLFAQALRRAERPFALHVFAHGAHGLGLAPQEPTVAAWFDLCVDWLRDLGW